MAEFTTWITETDGCVGRVKQTAKGKSPGPEWRQVPAGWRGNPGDKLSLLDDNGRRLPEAELIEKGLVIDNRGQWYHKVNIGESIKIEKLDQEAPGDEWTREEPLKDEPYQKWDSGIEKFVVDTEQKEKAEKERCISEKKAAIVAAEQGILRSLIAKQRGKATKEDEEYFVKFSAEIETLRNELARIEE